MKGTYEPGHPLLRNQAVTRPAVTPHPKDPKTARQPRKNTRTPHEPSSDSCEKMGDVRVLVTTPLELWLRALHPYELRSPRAHVTKKRKICSAYFLHYPEPSGLESYSQLSVVFGDRYSRKKTIW